MISNRRRLSAALALLLALMGWAPTASAQLPPAVYNATRPLTGEQAAMVNDYVRKNVESLKSGDGQSVADGRRALLEPLRRESSRPFRVSYNDALTPALAAVAADGAAPMASRQAAIHILGSLASNDSDAALKTALQAPEPAVRYAAATALERSMGALREDRHIFTNPAATEKAAATALRDALAQEEDAPVVRAMASAAASIPDAGVAVDAAAEGIVAQAHRLRDVEGAAFLDSLRVGLEKAQKRYVVDLFGGASIAAHEAMLVRAAASSLLLIANHAQADLITPENRQAYTDLARTSENLLNLLCRRDNTQTRVTSAVSAGQAGEVRDMLDSAWLAPNGPVYSHSAWDIPAGSIEEEFDR